MKLKYCILSLLFFYLNISSIQAVIPQMEVSPDERGVSSLCLWALWMSLFRHIRT